ncbi:MULTISPECIES: prohibitin family protein [Nostocales]|uniref:Prohibitin family protein n=3 Tax=Nostocales TaxID=1161 RepID=A0A8S9TFJ6_9CYAN|nr:prohibitin family protein [Tolypothrix bouteillei]KAF3890938.1 prohibitin family protein [Tolypothrix bouteillei VB521301]
MKKSKAFNNAGKLTALLVLITLFLTPFAIVNAGERGVLMEFGKVQDRVLGEGIHIIVPVVNTVKRLSVQVQKQNISAEASTKDLQNISAEVALNWHIIPEKANTIFQKIGDEKNVVDRIINPALEEVLKAIVAKYTAEEIILKREEMKAGVDETLTNRLANYHIAVDDVSLLHIHFSQKFNEAVESKQVAAQEAKRAEFIALKASKEAEARVNLAKGEAEAHKIIRENLTPEILEKQALEKWDGKLPVIVGQGEQKLLNLTDFLKSY